MCPPTSGPLLMRFLLSQMPAPPSSPSPTHPPLCKPTLPPTNSQFSSLCLRRSRHRLSTVPLSTTALSLPEILQGRGWSFSFCCLTYQRPRIKPFTGVPHFSKVRFMPLHFCERPRWHPFSLTERNPKWIFCFYKKR